MGLDFDWSRFEYEPWAMREAEDRPAGSPLVEWLGEAEADDNAPDPHDMIGTGPPLAGITT